MKSCASVAMIVSNELCNWLHSTPIVSKLGFASLIFIEPGIKVDGAYYRDVLQLEMLPAITSLWPLLPMYTM